MGFARLLEGSVPLPPASVFAGVIVFMVFWFVVVFAIVGLRQDDIARFHVLDCLVPSGVRIGVPAAKPMMGFGA